MNKKRISIIILLIVTTILTGCGPATSNTATETHNVGDVIENAERIREETIENQKEKYREDLERHYANGLYTEDLEEIRTAFNEAYRKDITEEITSAFKGPVIVKVEPVFYNKDLKTFKEENLTYEALETPEKHLRSVMVQTFMFYSAKELNYDFEHEKEDMKEMIGMQEYFNTLKSEYLEKGCRDPKFILSIHHPDVLKKESLENLEAQENLVMYLSKYKDAFVYRNISHKNLDAGIFSSHASYLLTKDLDILNENFKREFVPLWRYTYALKEDYNHRFSGVTLGNNYPCVMAQRIIGERINQIIKEEGGEDVLAQYTFVEESYEINDITFPFGEMTPEDELRYLREVFPNSYDTTFIYLLEPGEEPTDEDYDVFRRVVNRAWDIVNVEENNGDAVHNYMFGFFYELPKKDHSLIVDLFKKDMITYEYSKGSTNGIQGIYTNMYKTHEETDGFHYLDLYGKKKDFVLKITSRPGTKGGLEGQRSSSVY